MKINSKDFKKDLEKRLTRNEILEIERLAKIEKEVMENRTILGDVTQIDNMIFNKIYKHPTLSGYIFQNKKSRYLIFAQYPRNSDIYMYDIENIDFLINKTIKIKNVSLSYCKQTEVSVGVDNEVSENLTGLWNTYARVDISSQDKCFSLLFKGVIPNLEFKLLLAKYKEYEDEN